MQIPGGMVVRQSPVVLQVLTNPCTNHGTNRRYIAMSFCFQSVLSLKFSSILSLSVCLSAFITTYVFYIRITVYNESTVRAHAYKYYRELIAQFL